jgi:nitroreductase
VIFQESAEESWAARYGTGKPPEIGSLIERFFAHRSVRRFSDKPIDKGTMRALIAAAQSASTSSNLQLWSVISVQDPGNRRRVFELTAEQHHVANAPWFLAFFADHHRLRKAALEAGVNPNGLDYIEFFIMAVVDAALAAERLVCAAEHLGIGACYIGALRNNPYQIAELFKLPPGVFGIFGLTLGYPAETANPKIKPRLRQEAVWFEERYQEDVPIEDYDARMSEFYAREQMKDPGPWSQRSGIRVDEHHLTGRHVLKQFLDEAGFNKR